MVTIKQEEDGAKGRFVLYEKEVYAGEMTYSWAGDDKFIIDHTAVAEAFGGKGYGKKLLNKAVAFAREKKVKVLPLCPFAKAVFDKDKELNDLRF